jgi:hypothetical protein
VLLFKHKDKKRFEFSAGYYSKVSGEIMAQKISTNYNNLFINDNSIYHNQLNEYAEPLRKCARSMVDFIDKINNKTIALEALRKSYFKLAKMPIKNLCNGIEDIKVNLLKVEFLSKKSSIDPTNQADFINFFELQNNFNTELNLFAKKVIQLEMFT